MSDDKTKRGRQDRRKINVHEEYELGYWSKKFRVTPDELRDAVKRVGASLEAANSSAQHNIRFYYRCFDRILLNGAIQPFQQEQRVVGFFTEYPNLYPVSRRRKVSTPRLADRREL